MFFAEAPKEGNANARGESLLAPLPSPLGAFAVGRGRVSLKKMQLSNGVTIA